MFSGRTAWVIILSILSPDPLLPRKHYAPLGRSVVKRVSSTASFSIRMTAPLSHLALLLNLPLSLHLWVISAKDPGEFPAFILLESAPSFSEPSLLPPTPSLGLSAVSVINSNCGWVYGLSYGAPETQTNQGMWLDICLGPWAYYHS